MKSVVVVLRKIRFGFLVQRFAGLFHSTVMAASVFAVAEATPKLVLFVEITSVVSVHDFLPVVLEDVEQSVEKVVEEGQLGVEAILVSLAALVPHGASRVPHVGSDCEVVSSVVIAQGLGVVVVVPVALLAHDVSSFRG